MTTSSRPEPETVPDVVRRMELIAEQLPAADGVRWFNHLYLEVTRAVAAALASSSFRDAAFIERLDVVFADYYFRVLDAAGGHGVAVPSAWAPLFQCRASKAIAPIQFALCGMNAHINGDLPLALVDTCTELSGPGASAGPTRDSDRYRDYVSVNAILFAVETRVRREFESGLLADLDHLFPRAEDCISHWSVADAREAAWSSAQVLWSLRADPAARDLYLETLDHLVGFAGRGLLLTV